MLHPRLWHVSRRAVALGAAIGVFFAFLTPIAQIPLSAAASIVLRANIPTAVVATLVNSPPTFGPVYYAAWWVGSKVLGESVDDRRKPEVLVGKATTVEEMLDERKTVSVSIAANLLAELRATARGPLAQEEDAAAVFTRE